MSDDFNHPAGPAADCGCCGVLSAATPAAVENRPGLQAVAYRVGTHAQFMETMLARLTGADRHALRRLNTRDESDFSVALLDAWATVADVLTFYQERIANESYLRTATEWRSVLELARLIGYKLRPGVAANTYLAFTLEDAPGAAGQALSLGTTAQVVPAPPPPISVRAGTRVQSVPGEGEKPQDFETVEEIEARPEWNALRPRPAQPQQLTPGAEFVILRGTATNLKAGDVLLVVAGPAAPAVKTVLRVSADDAKNTTRVDFKPSPAPLPGYAAPADLKSGLPGDFTPGRKLDESAIAEIIAGRWAAQDLSAAAEMLGWPADQLVANINEQTARRTPNAAVYAFRLRAGVFGHNAPRWGSLPGVLRFGEYVQTKTKNAQGQDQKTELFVEPAYPAPGWEERTLDADAEPWTEGAPVVKTPVTAVSPFKSPAAPPKAPTIAAPSLAAGNRRYVYLDTTYPAVVKGGWALLRAASGQSVAESVYAVTDNVETTRNDFTLSTKVSRLTLAAGAPFGPAFRMRTTTVLAQSERLELADLPVADHVGGNSVTLDRALLGLKVGKRVILTGERTDLEGVYASEALTLEEVLVEAGFTVLVFDQALAHTYLRATVTVNANVAEATHGASVAEVMGSGDATRPFQSFTLRQPPLTHTHARTPSGSKTTLEVRVNDLLWHEVPTLYGRGPDERVYVTRTGDGGATVVQFGDGRTGARLPTGQENVGAKYRRGTGTAGLVKAHQLTQLLSRPLGLRGVTNPLPAAEAEDPEMRDAARRNAPLAILTLDRIVSLRDYEDFASAFSGVAKALATWTWSGEQRGVFVTIAGPGGAAIAEGGTLHTDLLGQMRAAGDPHVPLTVRGHLQRFFRLKAKVRIHPDYLPEKVLPEVEATMRGRFSFDARSFGQPITLGEVIGAIHSVEGVVAVDVDELYRLDRPTGLSARLNAEAPAPGRARAAELLTLDPRPLELEVLR